jgi:hypothetical protein
MFWVFGISQDMIAIKRMIRDIHQNLIEQVTTEKENEQQQKIP